jgi:alanine dehydrogenase
MTKVGVPKEIKNHEYRVGLTLPSVQELVNKGHRVFIETNAGSAIGFTDEMYRSVGATIVPTADEVFEKAELIIKVKEPQPSECKKLKPHHTLFTYLHLAPDPEQAEGLIKSGCTAIAYETVTDTHHGLPLLAPMSEVAGRMSIQVGARMLEKERGGSGILLGGVAGVEPAHVVVLGGGVVGYNAARIAVGMGAHVTIIDRNARRLNELDSLFEGRVRTIYANSFNIENYVKDADVVIGAVLVVGASAPKLVTRAMLSHMRPGSVLVDVAIDQGGCFETSKPTTHQDPSYEVDGIIHYCVTNMPGAVARTSAVALNNATLPFVMQLANSGTKKALHDNVHLLHGLNVIDGKVTYKAVAEALNYTYHDPKALIS